MEDIALIVSASLARHGFTTQVDHRRLQWSQWSRCESTFSALLVPGNPGLFELAEEQAADKPGSVSNSDPRFGSGFGPGLLSGFEPGFVSEHRFSDAATAAESGAPLGAGTAQPICQQSEEVTPRDPALDQRMLTLFRIAETEDLGMALARLFLLNTPERDRLSRKPCYVRYAVIEDEDQRRATYRSLQGGMASPSQSSSEIPDNLAVHNFTVEEEVEGGNKSAA